MKIVRVVWVDACMSGGWTPLPEAMAFDEVAVETVGFLVNQNKRWLKVAQSIHPAELGNTVEIPRAWILKVKKIGSL